MDYIYHQLKARRALSLFNHVLHYGTFLCTDGGIRIGTYNKYQGLFGAITFLLLTLEIWTVYHFVCHDLQINLAH